MKKILIIICIISCSNSTKKIIGKWEFIEYINNEKNHNISKYFIEFKPHNEAIVSGDGRSELKKGKVTYELKNDSIFISLVVQQSNGLSHEKDGFKYELVDDNLKLFNNKGITNFKRVLNDAKD